jgi:diaminopimelate decarboxylase
MVGGPSKFGFDEELVAEQVRSVRLRRARIGGIQVYSASSVLDAEWLAGHIEYVAGLARRLAGEIEFRLECIDFGGGFGVPISDEQPELDLRPAAGAAAQARAGLAGCRLLFESGRYLVTEAGVFVTRVVRVKESRGKVFAICDGGMNAFARPVFMRVTHPVRLLNRLDEPATSEVDVCGPICTPLDCIAKGVHLPQPEPGDVVGLLNAGAYGYSMSLLGFMSLGRPIELVADAGELRQA